MDQQELKHIVTNYFKKITKRLKRIIASFDPESIHLFRVTYKKLRAFLRMLSEQEEEAGELKMPRNLKKIYRVTGSIRDLQMHLLQIMDYTNKVDKLPSTYIKILQEELDRVQKKLLRHNLIKKVIRIKKKTLNAIPVNVTLSCFVNYILEKRTEIYAIIESGEFTDYNIHRIRKILKDIFYNLELYRIHEQQFILPEKWLKLNMEFFDELLEMLGNYQDKCTSIAFLRSGRFGHLNHTSRATIKRLKGKGMNEKKSQKLLIVKMVKNDLIQQLSVL